MNIKRLLLGVLVANLFALPMMAGTTAYTNALTYSIEKLGSGSVTITLAGTVSHVPANVIAENREIFINILFEGGSYADDGSFTNADISNRGTDGTGIRRIADVDGNGTTDIQLFYTVNTADFDPGAMDQFDFDFDGLNVEIDDQANIGSLCVTVQLFDTVGVFDETDNGTGCISLANSANTLTVTRANKGSAIVDVANNQQTFVGGSTTDATGTVNMTFNATTVLLDGTVISDLAGLGSLTITVDGEMDGVTGITIPNLNGGTSAATLDSDNDTASVTLTSGSTDVAGGSITFTIDGTTVITERVFTITASLTSMGSTTTKLATTDITMWTLNGTMLCTAFFGTGQGFTSFLAISNLSSNPAKVEAEVRALYSIALSGFENSDVAETDGAIGTRVTILTLPANATTIIDGTVISEALGVDLSTLSLPRVFVKLTIQSDSAKGISILNAGGVITATTMQEVGN